MASEAALSTSELLNLITYEAISTTPSKTDLNPPPESITIAPSSSTTTGVLRRDQFDPMHSISGIPSHHRLDSSPKESAPYRHGHDSGVTRGTKRKRRRRPRVCKNKEDAESQRMNHITIERNRRKQMNQHLAMLRSLMPESYAQRGDQASVVGGAIELIKELEHTLQLLESQKIKLQNLDKAQDPLHFSQFFLHPQYRRSHVSEEINSKSKASIADVEVTLIETHASVRVCTRRRRSSMQLSKFVSALHALSLSVLHLNVTTMEPLVLYSISAKVEDGCLMTSVDDIADAVNHLLRIIEDEASLLCCSWSDPLPEMLLDCS